MPPATAKPFDGWIMAKLSADALIEASPVATLIVDRMMRVVLANKPARTLFGLEIVDRPFVTVLRNPTINDTVESHLARPQEEPTSLVLKIAVQGRDIPVDVLVSSLNVNGERGVAVALTDRSPLERAEHMRRDFIANVSHELRTPLTALMGFIETLRGPARNDDGARERFLAIMERESSRMNRLVDDLLSLSRVEAEERRRPAQSIDLSGLLRNVSASLAPKAEGAEVKIVLHPTDRVAKTSGDPDQLMQVFSNLVENAIKYGGGGGLVDVSIKHIAHEPVLRGPAWGVTVADHGEGIEPEHLPRLTERFYRVDTHRSREQGGTGLGLAIVKHIVARHRGRLKIESEKGKGSRFSVILPDIGG